MSASRLPLEAGEILDADDLPFAEVAVAAQVKALVTGNARHFTFLDRLGIPVLSPADFLQFISAFD